MASTETLRHKATRLSGADGVHQAAALLRNGGLVAFPTETVYGLGALAADGVAVARIYDAKGRPSFNPLIVHLPDLSAVRRVAHLGPEAEKLAHAFWPGPMTLVLPLLPDAGIATLVTAGLETVAVRVPAAPLAQALLNEVGAPVAAPSANPSGRISATRADHVLTMMGDRIDAVLDGGPCDVGLESTILRPDPCVLLREGGLPAEDVERVIGRVLPQDLTPGQVQAPGQLSSHYAPASPVTLNREAARSDAVYIGFGGRQGDLTLSEAGDLVQAAATLFDALHQADALAHDTGRTRIDVAPIPDVGLGRAINDRLRRAAAPRS